MIADLPSTPREAYNALTGKRPDLLLTPHNRVYISTRVAFMKSDLGETPLIFGFWVDPDDLTKPQFVKIVGGMN